METPFDAWVKCCNEEREGILATILDMNQSVNKTEPCRLFVSRNEILGNLGDEEINGRVAEIARRKLTESNPKSETRSFALPDGKQVFVFIDVNIPRSELMIFGAGHDAIPVAQYAVSLGFKTTVVDQREFYNNEERFPGTTQLICKPTEFQDKIEISSRTYIVVMNHHIEKDKETLKYVLRSNAPYVGVLGPRSRRMRMIQALESEGVYFTEKELEKMYNPIGLDIGADSAEEIAISILAEVIALKNGHSGGFLKGSEYIHKAPAIKGQI